MANFPALHKDCCTETGTTFMRHTNTLKELGLSVPTQNFTNTSNEGILNSIETLYENRKSSLEDNYDYLNRAALFRNTPHTFMKNENFDYVIDGLVKHRKTPKETLYQVRWYRYDPPDDTLKPDANIPTHFITRYWLSGTGKTPKTFSQQVRPTSS